VFAEATTAQALAVLGAARAVVESHLDPHDLRSGRGDALLVAAGGLLFRPAVVVDPADVVAVTPDALAVAVGDDHDLAEHAAALVAVASLADGRADPDRLRSVVRYAHAVGVHDGWVRDLHEVARGHLAWAMGDMARRNVTTFPGWANADDTLPDMQPYAQQTDADRRLAERFFGLEHLAPSTYGHAFWRHFRRHGFAFPGEPTAFPGEFAVPHDGLHVLAGYSTSLQGELLVSTFTGAMHHRDALRAHLLPVIFEWHVGTEVNGIGAQTGALDPEKFLVAWQRGEATTFDVLDPTWDFWAAAEIDLDELRGRYGITPLEPADAAAGAEIVVAADADPDAR
jgi:hypothetical protein